MDALKTNEPFDPSLIDAVEAEVFAALESARVPDTPKRLRIAVEYALGGRDEEGVLLEAEKRRHLAGKRTRPLLLLSCAQCAGGSAETAMPLAAAVELIHNFSLVHDDIEDADEERRHRPSLWVLSGIPQAINTGSHMQAIVNCAAFRLSDSGISDSVVLRALKGLTDAILRMTEGQHLDLRLQESGEATLESYWRMVDGKTAALLRHSCALGGLIGGGDEALVEAFDRFGQAFGFAFQARDDYLGIWGDQAVTGKPVGSDLRRKKKTLPVVFGATEAEGSEKRKLENLFGKSQLSEDQAEEARVLLERLGAKEFTLTQVKKLTGDAYVALRSIRPAETEMAKIAYQRLEAIVEFALRREY